MKRFHFPLERVLAWRRAQARAEEIRLEALLAELTKVSAKLADTEQERNQAWGTWEAGRTREAGTAVSGAELQFLDVFREGMNAELARLRNVQAQCRRKLEVQQRATLERRRDVHLLERIREKQLAAWQRAWDREVEQSAAEAYLARWNTPGSSCYSAVR